MGARETSATIEIIAFFGESLELRAPVLRAAGAIDLNSLGFVFVGLCLAMWLVAVVLSQLWRSVAGGRSDALAIGTLNPTSPSLNPQIDCAEG